MTENINLKEIERKAFRSTFQDGLWDIYLGLLLLVMGSGMLLNDLGVTNFWNYVIMVVLAILTYAVFWAGKKFITVPRMGDVRFGPKGQARRKKTAVVLAISVLVGVVLFVTGSALYANPVQELNPGIILSAVYVLNTLIVFGLGAYFLIFDRLYLIGSLYALPLPLLVLADELLGIKLGFIVFAVPATIILFIGLVVLIRFLQDYPLATEGGFDGNHI